MRPVERGDASKEWIKLTESKQLRLQLIHYLRFEADLDLCEQRIKAVTTALNNKRPQNPPKKTTLKRQLPDAGDTGPWTKRDKAKRAWDDADAEYRRLMRNVANASYEELYALRTKLQSFLQRSEDTDLEIKDYTQARRELVGALGQYCSYCELPIAASLAVEHMLPKSQFPLRSLSWTNFLLACAICNSNKSDKPPRTGQKNKTEEQIANVALGTYFWPSGTDYNDFSAAFAYQLARVVYLQNGALADEEKIDVSTLRDWVNRKSIKFLDDPGHAVRISVEDHLGQIPAKDCSSGGKVKWTAKLLAKCRQHGLTLDPNNKGLGDINIDDPGDDVFPIREIRAYRLDLSGDPNKPLNVPVSEVSATGTSNRVVRVETIPGQAQPGAASADEWKKFRAPLNVGHLPKQVSERLSPAPYMVDASRDNLFIELERTGATIWVEKVLTLRRQANFFDITRGRTLHVELRLAPVSPLLDKKLLKAKTQVIDDLQLNRVNAEVFANKFTDRRMVKRTRTLLIALESIGRLADVTGKGAIQDALLKTMAETVKATGFWSVWWWACNNFIVGDRVRMAARDVLLQTASFPGTRRPKGQ
jgi:5-methylcytosine-specific restriction endonuclease McrA